MGEPVVSVSTGKGLWAKLDRDLKVPGRKYAAVAYVSTAAPLLLDSLRKGDVLVCNAGDSALATGATDPEALASLIERGVIVRWTDALHAKVIVGRGMAIVGSMNASTKSTTMQEAAVTVREESAVTELREFVRDLMRTKSFPVDDAFLRLARAKYRPPKSGGASAGPRTSGKGPRLGVWTYPAGEPPARVKKVIDAAASPSWATGTLLLSHSWGEPQKSQERLGDWVIQLDGERAYPPDYCWRVTRAAPPSKQVVAFWAEQHGAKAMRFDLLQRQLRKRGLALSEESWHRQEGLIEAVHECFGLDMSDVLDALGVPSAT